MNLLKRVIKKSNLSIFLCIILVLLYFGFEVKKKQKEQANIQKLSIEYQHELRNLNSRVKELINHCKYMLTDERMLIDSTLSVQKENKESVHMWNLFQNHPKLVFRYSELNCNVCVEKEVELLKKFIEEIGIQNMLMMTNGRSSSYNGQFKRMNQFDIEIYNVEDLGLKLDKINTPYYFVLDSDWKAKSVFVPSKSLPSQTRAYYDIIKDKYWN